MAVAEGVGPAAQVAVVEDRAVPDAEVQADAVPDPVARRWTTTAKRQRPESVEDGSG